MRFISFASTIFLVSLLVSGCGGSSGNDTTGSTTGGTTGSTTDNTVTSISVSPSTGSFTQANQTLQLSASAFNSSGQSIGFNPTWSSSNNTVATVNASGLVTSQSNGTATITVSSGGISETVTVSVDITDGVITDVPLSDRDVAGSNFFITDNNTARLFGPVIGDGSQDNDNARKLLSFNVSTPNSSISIRQAYAVDSVGSLATLIMIVRNLSNTTMCQIRLNDVELTGVSGSPFSSSSASASASVAALGSIYTASCLAPNEQGYVIKQGTFNLSDISSVSIDTIVTSSTTPTAINEVARPLSYTVSGSELEILVVNQSTIPIDVFSYRYVVLDELGLPLYEGLDIPDTVLQPGEEVIFSDTIRFQGSASTLRVILGFDPADISPQAAPNILGTWDLVSATVGGLSRGFTKGTLIFFEDGLEYYSLVDSSESCSGTVNSRYNITENSFRTALPDTVVINGFSGSSDGDENDFNATILCTQSEFTDIAGPALGWDPSGSTLSLIATENSITIESADGRTQLIYTKRL